MPIRKTDKGYYWGSKGPFATRAQAVRVAAAAYASGYKEGELTMNHDGIKKLLATLMCGQICLRLIHWNTTSYAEHKAPLQKPIWESMGGLVMSHAHTMNCLMQLAMWLRWQMQYRPCGSNCPMTLNCKTLLMRLRQPSIALTIC